MDLKNFKELKKDLILFKKNLNILINEQGEEVKDDGGLFDGDFNSEASEQSWSEFFMWYSFSPGLAVAKEISTWHGSRERKLIYDPVFSPLNGDKAVVPVSESWTIKYIDGNTKASDLINDPNVKSDEIGEYYELKTAKQVLKLYLPNSSFFEGYATLGVAYQFITDNGTKYQLVLTLESDQAINQLLSGAKDSNSVLMTSMQNQNPELGNGWAFKFDPKNTSSAYWTQKGNNLESYNAGRILTKDLKSSFGLWWEKWGVVAQIVAAVALSFLAPPLGAWIAGRAIAIWGAESAVAVWLGSNVALGISFNANMSIVLAEFLLEAAVNVPAAVIDMYQENQFGAYLGIMFCAFPTLIRMGKLGRFIEPYSDDMAKGLAKKMALGLYENMSADKYLKFIEGLSPQEKYIFARATAYLSKEGVPESVEKGIKELMQEAVSKGTFPKAFKRWYETGFKTGIKTLTAGGLFWGGSTVLYGEVKKLMDQKGDTRDIESVKQSASINAEKLSKLNSEIDNDPNLGPSSTLEILTSLTDGELSGEGPKNYYELSLGDDKPSDFIKNKIADRKMKEAEEAIKRNKEDEEFFNKTKYPSTKTNLESLNNKTTNPKSQEEINGLIMNPNEMDGTDLEVILSDSNKPMSTEVAEVENAFPCLKDNFDAVEGDYFYNNGKLTWFVRFKCVTPMTLPTWAGYDINVKTNQSIYIYEGENGSYNWIYSADSDDLLHKGFRCKK